MTSGRPTFYVHIGTRKSGTTYLQRSLRKSTEALRAQGVAIPFGDWPGHRRQLGDPLNLAVGDDEVGARARATLRASAELCRAAEEHRMLASYEELAELDPDQIRLFAEHFGDFDIRIIVTSRHWGSTLPSEWQQQLKERLTTASFRDYADAVRRGDGPDAERFLRRHDVVDIVQRWGEVFGMDRTIVVPLPSHTSDPRLLIDLICGLIGVDPSLVEAPGDTVNTTLSYAAAETLRRINVTHGNRMPKFVEHHRSFVFRNFLQRPLRQRPGPSAQVPVEYRPWLEEAARTRVEALRGSGCVIVGELDDLLVTDWPEPVPEPTDAEIAQAAIDVAADLSLRMVKAAGDPSASGEPKPEPGFRFIRRLLRRDH